MDANSSETVFQISHVGMYMHILFNLAIFFHPQHKFTDLAWKKGKRDQEKFTIKSMHGVPSKKRKQNKAEKPPKKRRVVEDFADGDADDAEKDEEAEQDRDADDDNCDIAVRNLHVFTSALIVGKSMSTLI